MSIFNLFKRAEEAPQNCKKPDFDSTFYSMRVKQLPTNFAQSVMDF